MKITTNIYILKCIYTKVLVKYKYITKLVTVTDYHMLLYKTKKIGLTKFILENST